MSESIKKRTEPRRAIEPLKLEAERKWAEADRLKEQRLKLAQKKRQMRAKRQTTATRQRTQIAKLKLKLKAAQKALAEQRGKKVN